MGTREWLSVSGSRVPFSKLIWGIVNKAMGIHLIGVVNMSG